MAVDEVRVEVVVEVPRGGRNKYEWDERSSLPIPCGVIGTPNRSAISCPTIAHVHNAKSNWNCLCFSVNFDFPPGIGRTANARAPPVRYNRFHSKYVARLNHDADLIASPGHHHRASARTAHESE